MYLIITITVLYRPGWLNVDLFVFDDSSIHPEISKVRQKCGSINQPYSTPYGPYGTTKVVRCPLYTALGRYVLIKSTLERGILTMCEVEVYGRKCKTEKF